MTSVSIAEAARRIGHKSRSQLYRLIDNGTLKDHLRRSPSGARLLELSPPGLPTLEERVADCTAERVNSASRPMHPKHQPEQEAEVPWYMRELWIPITRRVNLELIAQGMIPLSSEQILATHRAIEDAIEQDHPEFDTESVEWWQATLDEALDSSPLDPCPDPWCCDWCGKPWHLNHPQFEHSPAMKEYVAELRRRYPRHASLRSTDMAPG